MDNVYENIYIHIEVVNEFRIETERKSILDEIKRRDWNLFDHKEKSCVPDDHKSLYWKYVNEVSEGFENLKTKKQVQGRLPKTSNNIGEIHSIALAQLISANIISSNDFEIHEVISDENIQVYSADLNREVYIEQEL